MWRVQRRNACTRLMFTRYRTTNDSKRLTLLFLACQTTSEYILSVSICSRSIRGNIIMRRHIAIYSPRHSSCLHDRWLCAIDWFVYSIFILHDRLTVRFASSLHAALSDTTVVFRYRTTLCLIANHKNVISSSEESYKSDMSPLVVR